MALLHEAIRRNRAATFQLSNRGDACLTQLLTALGTEVENGSSGVFAYHGASLHFSS